MKNNIKIITLFTSLLLAFNVFAINLQTAKSQGLVGEQPNGYLGAVKETSEIQLLVKDINQKRQAAYLNIAKKNKLSLQQVAELAGKKAIGKTPKGQYIQTTDGKWVKK